MTMKKSSDTIGNRSRDHPVCSAVPQPLRHRVPLYNKEYSVIIELRIRRKATPIYCTGIFVSTLRFTAVVGNRRALYKNNKVYEIKQFSGTT
jgi:hypothetical protein